MSAEEGWFLGLASFRMADFMLCPFGRQLVKRPDAGVP
jgi:uncharacterized membrane protein YccF (DUF307 family)